MYPILCSQRCQNIVSKAPFLLWQIKCFRRRSPNQTFDNGVSLRIADQWSLESAVEYLVAASSWFQAYLRSSLPTCRLLCSAENSFLSLRQRVHRTHTLSLFYWLVSNKVSSADRRLKHRKAAGLDDTIFDVSLGSIRFSSALPKTLLYSRGAPLKISFQIVRLKKSFHNRQRPKASISASLVYCAHWLRSPSKPAFRNV